MRTGVRRSIGDRQLRCCCCAQMGCCLIDLLAVMEPIETLKYGFNVSKLELLYIYIGNYKYTTLLILLF